MFVVRNVRDKDIEVGSRKLAPGEDFSSEQLTDDIHAAANKSDISITVVAENPKVSTVEPMPVGGGRGVIGINENAEAAPPKPPSE